MISNNHFQFDRKFSQKRLKSFPILIFTSNLFLFSLTRTPLSHTHCFSQSFTAPTHTPSQTERSTPTHHDRDLASHRNCADRHRSRSRSHRSASIAIIEIDEIAIAISPIEITPIAIAISPRKYDLFWVLFEFLGMNDIMCLFGS